MWKMRWKKFFFNYYKFMEVSLKDKWFLIADLESANSGLQKVKKKIKILPWDFYNVLNY